MNMYSRLLNVRGVLASVALCVAFWVNAQQPANPGLENWEQSSNDKLSNWQQLGLVNKTTDADEGTYALKLAHTKGSTLPGVVTNGAFSDDIEGGVPFTETPDLFHFRAKHELNGDSAAIGVIFKSKGQIIGFASATISGVENDFTDYAVGCDLFETPDSMLIVLTSFQFEKTALNDGFIIMDDFYFSSGGKKVGAFTNAQMENWTGFDYDLPQNWSTLNYAAENSNQLTVSKAGQAYEGSFCAKLKNAANIPNLFEGITPGILSTNPLELVATPAIKVNNRWKFLTTYAKYLSFGDTAYFAVYMFKNGEIIGQGFALLTDAIPIWTKVDAQIVYVDDRIPDSANIIITSANFENPQSELTELYIDDIKFRVSEGQIDAIQPLFSEELIVYPNPATQQVTLDNITSQSSVTIIDALGRTVYQNERVKNSLQINIEEWPAGVYTVVNSGENLNKSKRFVVR